MMSEDRIMDFGSRITDLMRGRNLTRSEACEMFRQVLINEQPDLQQGAFLVAMTAKGVTTEEYAGI